jgi:hypothetical protein
MSEHLKLLENFKFWDTTFFFIKFKIFLNLNLGLVHLDIYIVQIEQKNKKYMVVKSRQSLCLVTNLIFFFLI